MAHHGFERGDWFRTFVSRFSPVCKEYTDVRPHGRYERSIQPETYFGPVHEIRLVDDYVVVQVPSSSRNYTLVWVNVQKGPVRFANKANVAAWQQRGWVNTFLN